MIDKVLDLVMEVSLVKFVLAVLFVILIAFVAVTGYSLLQEFFVNPINWDNVKSLGLRMLVGCFLAIVLSLCADAER